jgi:hypothetical protein
VKQIVDKLWLATRAAAKDTAAAMGLDDGTLAWQEHNDGPLEVVYAALDGCQAPSMVVVGDWRKCQFDIYDAVLRFGEDKYGRLRHKKFHAGTYLVIMSKKLGEAK